MMLAVMRGQTGSGSPEVEIQTAPDGDVLPGIVRTKVLDACQKLGISVTMRAPNSNERDTWSEVFVCNSIRQLQPVQRIVSNGGAPSFHT